MTRTIATRISKWPERLADQDAALCQKVRRHDAYYRITGNGESLSHFRYLVHRAWRRWLRRRHRKRKLDWPKFNRLLARFPLPPLRVVHSIFGYKNTIAGTAGPPSVTLAADVVLRGRVINATFSTPLTNRGQIIADLIFGVFEASIFDFTAVPITNEGTLSAVNRGTLRIANLAVPSSGIVSASTGSSVQLPTPSPKPQPERPISISPVCKQMVTLHECVARTSTRIAYRMLCGMSPHTATTSCNSAFRDDKWRQVASLPCSAFAARWVGRFSQTLIVKSFASIPDVGSMSVALNILS